MDNLRKKWEDLTEMAAQVKDDDIIRHRAHYVFCTDRSKMLCCHSRGRHTNKRQTDRSRSSS